MSVVPSRAIFLLFVSVSFYDVPEGNVFACRWALPDYPQNVAGLSADGFYGGV
jgi:hypothetical protein